MTSSDTPERRGAPVDPSTEREAIPPWQKVAKDAEELAADRWSSGDFAAEEDSYPESDSRFLDTNGKPVLSGAAVRGAPAEPGARPAFGKSEAWPSSGAKSGRPAPTALRRPGRGPRRASLQIKRFDPWSVLKLSLVLGVAMFFVWMVGVGVLYTVLDGMGVWDKLNGTYSSLVSGENGATPGDPLISVGRVLSIAAILGAINIVLVSALSTVGAFIYNVSADLAGGLEVTLSERE